MPKEAIEELTPDKIQTLTENQIQALTVQQIMFLSLEKIKELKSKFNENQCKNIIQFYNTEKNQDIFLSKYDA